MDKPCENDRDIIIPVTKENVLKAFDSLKTEENLGVRHNWEMTFRNLFPQAFEKKCRLELRSILMHFYFESTDGNRTRNIHKVVVETEQKIKDRVKKIISEDCLRSESIKKVEEM